MKLFCDLHLHSRYARATSKHISIKNLAKFGKMKGLHVLGTGDFQHPLWLKELRQELQNDNGLYQAHGMHFMLTTEISLMYSHNGRGRRVHLVMWAPDFGVACQVQEELLKHGRIDYDGRPIFKMNCPTFVSLMKSISQDIEIIPAHVWTPWFSLYGSKSGYDSLKECFEDQTKHVHAIETGLSSDPPMNWRLSELDDKTIVSFSDAHSHWPWKLGRECTVFQARMNYKSIVQAVRNNHVEQTLEFFPEEGKYHYDGHRNCNVCLAPSESIQQHDICPVCKKTLTIGVAHRVEELATREKGQGKPFIKLIPLTELIAAHHGCGLMTKKVWATYYDIIKTFGTEFNALLDASMEQLASVAGQGLAELIIANREQRILFKPGYDGVFGQPLLEGWKSHDVPEEQRSVKPAQKNLQQY